MSGKTQWLVLCKGQAYSKTLGRDHDLFVLRMDDGTWCVWRAKWETGNPKPVSQKTLAEGLDFKSAVHRANNYIAWRKKRGWMQ